LGVGTGCGGRLSSNTEGKNVYVSKSGGATSRGVYVERISSENFLFVSGWGKKLGLMPAVVSYWSFYENKAESRGLLRFGAGRVLSLDELKKPVFKVGGWGGRQ